MRSNPFDGTLNLVEKMAALLDSHEVRMWQFPLRKTGPQFFYWLTSEPGDTAGHQFDTLEAMIADAFDRVFSNGLVPTRVLAPHQFLHPTVGSASKEDLEEVFGGPISVEEYEDLKADMKVTA